MSEYYIKTDSRSMEIEADDIGDALEEFGAPRSVRTAEDFEAWLETSGGYGWIDEDSIRIAEVRP